MRYRLSLLCVLVLALGLAACDSKEQAGGSQPPAYVVVADITLRDVPWPAEYQATAAGSRAVDVRSRVQGIIEKRLYKEGDFIRAGQIMFQLERDQYEATYDEAKAAFMNAEREWKRVRPLYKANAVSQKERDAALSAYESTKAAMRRAKINLDYCQVEAPVSGFTSKEAVTAGNLVANNTLLTTVNQTDPMFIDFSIAAPERMERQAMEREGRLKTPDGGIYTARLRLLDGRMYDRQGVVDFIDSQVQPSTGVISARATFPNGDSTIMPGQYVRIFMDGDMLIRAVLIPQSSVQITPDGNFVYVVDRKTNTVHRVSVSLGPAIGKDFLVNKGLKGDERIVVDGMLKTFDGGTVRYDDPAAPAGKAPAASGDKAPAAPAGKAPAAPGDKAHAAPAGKAPAAPGSAV